MTDQAALVARMQTMALRPSRKFREYQPECDTAWEGRCAEKGCDFTVDLPKGTRDTCREAVMEHVSRGHVVRLYQRVTTCHEVWLPVPGTVWRDV